MNGSGDLSASGADFPAFSYGIVIVVSSSIFRRKEVLP